MSDYTQRGNLPHINRAREFQPFPEWVGNLPTAANFTRMSKEAFADRDARRYPISNPTAAFFSALDAFYHADEVAPAVLDRVKAACAMFDIDAAVAPYLGFFAEDLEKSAGVATPTFALDLSLHGATMKLLPVGDRDQVVKAASDLHDMLAENRIPYPLARPAAITIVKAAAEFAVPDTELPLSIRDLGTERCMTNAPAQIRSEMAKRASWGRVDDDILKTQYNSAVDDFEADGDSNSLLHKVANYDMLAEVHLHYRLSPQCGHVDMPHNVIFTGPTAGEVEKIAARTVVINDIMVPLQAFANLNRTAAEFRLSKRAANSVGNIMEADDARDVTLEVANWPDEDRRTLCRLLVEANP